MAQHPTDNAGRKSRRRQVAGSISLYALARAGVSGYDKRAVVEKQQLQKLNKFRQYKKLQQRLQAAGKLLTAPSISHIEEAALDDANPSPEQQQASAERLPSGATFGQVPNEVHRPAAEQQQGQNKKRKHTSNSLQRAADDVKAQQAAKRQAREEAERERQERKTKIEAREKQRRTAKAQYFKKTRHGQPVMKYRIDKILSHLESN